MTAPVPWDPVAPPPRGLVRPVRADPDGRAGPTPGQAAGPHWRQATHGWHVPATTPPSPEQRALEQAVRLPAGAAVTGWAALRLHGAAYFEGLDQHGRPLPVPLAVGRERHLRAGAGATVSREPLAAAEVVVRHGVPVTEPTRALFDALRAIADPRAAVVAADMAAAAGLVPLARLQGMARARSSWRRARSLGWVLDHADEHSRSPGETRFRLVWTLDAGLPRPLVNQEIFARGRLVAVADLLDPGTGLVGEYDGADHLRVARRSKDLDREARLRSLGLEYVAAVAPDLRRTASLVIRLRNAHDRARTTTGQRAWTLEPPAGWPREPSLEERLVVRELSRAPLVGSVPRPRP